METTLVHELGHVLGFTSRLDSRLVNCARRGQVSSSYNYLTPFDLFTYSAESLAGGAIDWAVDDRPKYFSLDGGQSSLGAISTGLPGFVWGAGCTGGGDGFTRGHWINVDGAAGALGIMDPATATDPGPPALFQTITALDLTVMDVIGWDTLPMFTEITGFNAQGGTGQLQWKTVNGAATYSVLGSTIFDELPLPMMTGITGNSVSLSAIAKVQESFFVEARSAAARPALGSNKAKTLSDPGTCACHLHGEDHE